MSIPKSNRLLTHVICVALGIGLAVMFQSQISDSAVMGNAGSGNTDGFSGGADGRIPIVRDVPERLRMRRRK